MKLNLTRHLASPVNEPFWGPTTSTVDWCETNYEVSPFVAEFFNALSSWALVIIGLLGCFLHSWAEKRFHTAFIVITIVGLGSVAFHGTLQKSSQALDEVPMLYTAFAFVYISLCQRFKLKASKRYYLAVALISHAIVTSYLVTAFDGRNQFWLFHFSFGSAEFFSIYQMIRIYIDSLGSAGSDGAVSRRIFERGLLLYFSAFAFWLTDMLGCEYVNPWYTTAILPFNPQFHAWWHIVVSLGLYNLTLYMLFNRMTSLDSGFYPKIFYFYGLVPYIKMLRVTPNSKIMTRSQSKSKISMNLK